jgi:hypothetical protein
MATAVILDKVKALTHGCYHFRGVWSQEEQPSPRKVKIKNFANICDYHGNGRNLEIFKLWIHIDP